MGGGHVAQWGRLAKRRKILHHAPRVETHPDILLHGPHTITVLPTAEALRERMAPARRARDDRTDTPARAVGLAPGDYWKSGCSAWAIATFN